MYAWGWSIRLASDQSCLKPQGLWAKSEELGLSGYLQEGRSHGSQQQTCIATCIAPSPGGGGGKSKAKTNKPWLLSHVSASWNSKLFEPPSIALLRVPPVAQLITLFPNKSGGTTAIQLIDSMRNQFQILQLPENILSCIFSNSGPTQRGDQGCREPRLPTRHHVFQEIVIIVLQCQA